MTKAEQFEALALRCEQATGPDRRLDAEIDCLARFPNLRPAEPDDHRPYQRGVPPGAGDIWCPTGFLMAASYTDSVDAALTLVPDGAQFDIVGEQGSQPARNKCFAKVATISVWTAATPALALCAAALRARAQMERGR